jgi:acyl-CoA synthetase (AMP-forming)/AMP-acid ligase II
MADTIGSLIEGPLHRDPDKPAIVSDEGTISYGELDRLANELGAAVGDLSVMPGQRIGVLARNTPFYPVILLAAARIGAILVPLSVRATPSDLAHAIDHAGITLLFVEPEFENIALSALAGKRDVTLALVAADGFATAGTHTIGSLLARGAGRRPQANVDPASAGIVMFTSGTTGKPKGVTISHLRYARLFEQQAKECNIRADDVLQLTMPLFHNGGMVGVLGCGLAAGATIAFYSGAFDPGRVLAHARTHGVTIAHWIPTMLARLVEYLDGRLADLPRLRSIHYGSMPMTSGLLRKTEAAFPVALYQTYGTTDCGLIAVLRPEHRAEGRIATGRLLADTHTRIVDPAGNEVAIGDIGEIIVDASTSGMLGYWNDADMTAETIRNGWIYSGDLARREADGFISLVGRRDGLIISGGENIYPAEVEDVIAAHPNVAETIVIGVPDSDLGEMVCAVVATRARALDLPSLRAFCAGRLAAYKIPRKLVVVEALPRTPSGKIARGAARDMARDLLSRC